MPNERFMRHYYGASGYMKPGSVKRPLPVHDLHVRNINGKITVSVRYKRRWYKVYEEQLGYLKEPVSFFRNLAVEEIDWPFDEVLEYTV